MKWVIFTSHLMDEDRRFREVRLFTPSAPLQSEEGRLRFTLKSTVCTTEPQTCWLLSLCSIKLRHNVLINNIFFFLVAIIDENKKDYKDPLVVKSEVAPWRGYAHVSFSTNILLFKGPSSPQQFSNYRNPTQRFSKSSQDRFRTQIFSHL